MTGKRPGLYWLVCWKFVSPVAMSLILVASVVDIFLNGSGYEAWTEEPAVGEKEGGEELVHTVKMKWPSWAWVLIVVLISISVLWIPAVAILRQEEQVY